MANFYGIYPVGSGGGGGGTAFQETPAGAVNSSNVTFTLSQAPGSAAALDLFLDGLILYQGVDYSLSGSTITMTSPPLFGQTLYATYTVVSAGAGVTDLNGLTGSINLVAGAGISVTPGAGIITIAATASSPLSVSGTRGAPNVITAAGGISFAGTAPLNKNYITSNGGAVTITANPQIAAGNADGQQLVLQSRSATDTVQISDGTGLVLNGSWIGGLDSSITLTWDGTNWVEMSRQ